jgi:hypothetical protein
MTTTALEPLARTLVALTPGDIPGAQLNLSTWCRAKIAGLGVELREQRQNYRQARAAKWKISGWQSQINRTKRRMVYYAKIKSAVDAGYLVVPNFDLDIFAIRTTRATPPQEWDRTSAQPDLSPARRGRYVDDVVFSYETTEVSTNKDGTKRETKHDVPTRYDLPDIPLRGVKPVVLDAVQRAMALRIFDQLGVVKQRRQDPIICGQIVDPDHNGRYWKKTVCFFVAWWLDPESL